MFYVANKFVVSLDSITFAGKKTCFMKEFFIHHVFEIIIIVIAYAKKSMTQLSHGSRMVLNQREQTCCFCFL